MKRFLPLLLLSALSMQQAFAHGKVRRVVPVITQENPAPAPVPGPVTVNLLPIPPAPVSVRQVQQQPEQRALVVEAKHTLHNVFPSDDSLVTRLMEDFRGLGDDALANLIRNLSHDLPNGVRLSDSIGEDVTLDQKVAKLKPILLALSKGDTKEDPSAFFGAMPEAVSEKQRFFSFLLEAFAKKFRFEFSIKNAFTALEGLKVLDEELVRDGAGRWTKKDLAGVRQLLEKQENKASLEQFASLLPKGNKNDLVSALKGLRSCIPGTARNWVTVQLGNLAQGANDTVTKSVQHFLAALQESPEEKAIEIQEHLRNLKVFQELAETLKSANPEDPQEEGVRKLRSFYEDAPKLNLVPDTNFVERDDQQQNDQQAQRKKANKDLQDKLK